MSCEKTSAPDMRGRHTHLEKEAVVSGGLVFVLIVFADVHVHIIKLDQAHQVTGRLEKKGKQKSADG